MLAPKQPHLVHHLFAEARPFRTVRMEDRRVRSDQHYLLMAGVGFQTLHVNRVRRCKHGLHRVQKDWVPARLKPWRYCASSGWQLAVPVIWASARVSLLVQSIQRAARRLATHDLVSL